MKITKKNLEKLIKEEIEALLEDTVTVGQAETPTNMDGSRSKFSGTSGKTFKTSSNFSNDQQTRAMQGDLTPGDANNIANQNQLMANVSEVAGRLAELAYPNIDDDPSALLKDLTDIQALAKMLHGTFS